MAEYPATTVETDPVAEADLATHAADTTNVHGITDTSTLVLTGDARLSDTRVPTDGSVTAAKVNSALKPSGSAAAGDEALRALGAGSTQAAAGDDSRFPTSGQKNALAGSSGTPGTTNKYVTDQDSRNSDTRTPTDASVTDAKIATTLSQSKVTNLTTDLAAKQPLDSDLTAIAALTTTSYGRGFLELADAAAGRTALALGTAATQASTAFDAAGAAAAAQAASQPLDSDLTAIAALSTTSYGRSLLALVDAAAGRTLLAVPPMPITGTHAARLASSPTTGQLWKETDTGLIYLWDGSAWVIFKGDGAVLKTADETVNNSAAVQDDDHLFFPIEANERWFVEGFLIVNAASVNADWKLNLSGPTGATGSWRTWVSGAWLTVAAASSPVASVALGSSSAAGAIAGEHLIAFAGMVLAASTAGTIKVQWAQNTATVEDNKILAGSHLRLRRLA